jgi:hypothetical protein
MCRDNAPSDCCNLTLAFRGREKFSTMPGSVGVPWRLSTGDERPICSGCRASKGNLRVSAGDDVSCSAASGMKGLEESPGKADLGCLCVGADSPLARWDGG